MPSEHKYKRLDSIRGLAAFSVGVGHAALLTPFVHGSWLHRGIVAVFSGHYAVDVFFVLSGFVLTHMVRELSGPDYVAYLGRRLLRLYPPLWAGLIFAYAAYMFVSSHFPCAGSGCTFISAGPTSLYGALRYAFPTTYELDPVVWSIRVEIEASIVYPFLLVLWRLSNGGWRITLLSGAGLMTLCSAYGFDTPQPHYMLFFLGLPHFLLLFLTGIALSEYRLERHGGLVLAAGIGLLLLYGFAFSGHSGHTGIDDIVATVSAAAIISVAAYRCPSWLAGLLDNPGVHKLGELSYSYYLLNAVILWVIVRMIGETTEPAAVLFLVYALVAAAITVPVSWAMNAAIEKPCIRWMPSGRKTGSQLVPKARDRYCLTVRCYPISCRPAMASPMGYRIDSC